MKIIKPRIYLASQSSRRRELLKQIGINFEMLLLRSSPGRSVGVDETPHSGEPPEDYVRRVCRAKVEAGCAALGLRSLPPFPVLAADTTVALGGHVETALSTSTVRFAALDEERIQRYLLTREYTDKAGAYAIQGHAGAFVEHISGSYSGVMGLPLFETVQLLQHFDYPTP